MMFIAIPPRWWNTHHDGSLPERYGLAAESQSFAAKSKKAATTTTSLEVLSRLRARKVLHCAENTT